MVTPIKTNRGWVASIPVPVGDIRRRAADPSFLSAVQKFYQELDGRIAAHQPVCVGHGDCCRFGAFGHRLFVTPVELAYFLAGTAVAGKSPELADDCPYQAKGRCSARDARPTGCRIFFCDPASRSWQPSLTEETLAGLADLHRRFHLPYVYVDWIQALEQIAAV
ncbi:MAG: hypothetical protein ACYSVY_16140 [Planctomycetota bacterium]|jgi:hypothetical protein